MRRSCTLLVPTSGDQFRIKLGGLERARAIRPGVTADEEPLIAADLAALAVMLQELAVGCEDDAAAVELARVVAWIGAAEERPTTAAEVRDAIAAIGAASVVDADYDDPPGAPLERPMVRPERSAHAFGQISLLMSRERPVDPSRIAASPGLLAAIVLLGVITALLTAWFGAPEREPEARRVSVVDSEPVPAPAPRTVPIERPAPFMPREVVRRCDDVEPVATRTVAPPQRKTSSSSMLPKLQPIAPATAMPDLPPPPVVVEPPPAVEPPDEPAADPTDILLPVRSRLENTASAVFLGTAQSG